MALNTQIQAACLLLLVLTGLANGFILQQQTKQLADPQSHDTTGAQARMMPALHSLRRRDTHFPICTFCCECCRKSTCGFCCKT
ncbi:hepcidin [Ochotona curzoniae]|uniref:hepcidin n=1 Tax=Ochotona curzoniae TaxID=130825 RepID=UPI001B34C4E1|nr:hepcidin [Ochotona curzoniae]